MKETKEDIRKLLTQSIIDIKNEYLNNKEDISRDVFDVLTSKGLNKDLTPDQFVDVMIDVDTSDQWESLAYDIGYVSALRTVIRYLY